MQISFENVTAALNDPLSPPIPTNVPIAGLNLQVKATKWATWSQDSLGYYHGATTLADAVTSVQIVVLLMQNGRSNQPDPTPPMLTNDYYGASVIGSETSVPWWFELAAILGWPLYLPVLQIGGLLGVDLFYPTIVANANNQAAQGLQSALGGLFQNQKAQMVAQLPGARRRPTGTYRSLRSASPATLATAASI